MRIRGVVLLSVAGLLAASTRALGQADASPGPGLPRVLLVGDSIRLGYAPGVAARLAGRAVVISPAENGGDICQWTRILTRLLNPNCYEV